MRFSVLDVGAMVYIKAFSDNLPGFHLDADRKQTTHEYIRADSELHKRYIAVQIPLVLLFKEIS